mgnify:CR=1 FL=1
MPKEKRKIGRRKHYYEYLSSQGYTHLKKWRLTPSNRLCYLYICFFRQMSHRVCSFILLSDFMDEYRYSMDDR